MQAPIEIRTRARALRHAAFDRRPAVCQAALDHFADVELIRAMQNGSDDRAALEHAAKAAETHAGEDLARLSFHGLAAALREVAGALPASA